MASTTGYPTASTIQANTSFNGTVDLFDYELEFLMCSIFSIPLGLGALYVALTQLAYGILKVNSAKPKKPDKRLNSSGSGRPTRSKANVHERYAFVLNAMCAFAAICAFLRAGVDFRLTFGKYNDLGCDLSIKFKLANYALSLITVYLVLWLRQRIFYQHPRLKHLSSPFIRFVSWSMSLLIIAGTTTTAVIFFAVGKYLGSPNGCVVQKGPLTTIRWMILIGCTTFFQICLLALFIYPLAKHNTGVKSGAPGDSKRNPIIPLIQRATITSAVCVVTDIAFAAIILILKKEVVTMSTFIYDVNIVTNVVCLVLSFPDWKVRFMPWRVKESSKDRPDDSSEGTSKNRTSETHFSSGRPAV